MVEFEKLCHPQSKFNDGRNQIWKDRQASAKVWWTIQDFKETMKVGIVGLIAIRIVTFGQHVSCVPIMSICSETFLYENYRSKNEEYPIEILDNKDKQLKKEVDYNW